MILGAHVILYTKDADATRAFFRDTLGLAHVDAGEGWLIFALPPAEMGIHPDAEGDSHELYLMCDDIGATMTELQAKGVVFTGPPNDYGWGVLATMHVPGGEKLGLYQPRHPLAITAAAAPGAARPRRAAAKPARKPAAKAKSRRRKSAKPAARPAKKKRKAAARRRR